MHFTRLTLVVGSIHCRKTFRLCASVHPFAWPILVLLAKTPDGYFSPSAHAALQRVFLPLQIVGIIRNRPCLVHERTHQVSPLISSDGARRHSEPRE